MSVLGVGVRLYFCWDGNMVIEAGGCLLVCLNSEWAMTEKVSGGGVGGVELLLRYYTTPLAVRLRALGRGPIAGDGSLIVDDLTVARPHQLDRLG